MCTFNYTIYARNQVGNNSLNYDIDNYLLFSDDIPEDSSLFSCSKLLNVAVTNSSLVSSIGQEFASLQCSISRYFYLIYDQNLPINKLSILNVPKDMNDAFVKGSLLLSIKPEKLGPFDCVGKSQFNYTLSSLGLIS